MNLLVVSACFPPAWSWGGPVRSIWNMCRGLAQVGARLRVLTTDADLEGTIEVPRRREEEGVDIATYPVARWGGRLASRYAFAPGLVRAMQREIPQAELCVFQGPWTFPVAVGSGICRQRGVSYVLCPRGALEGISLSEKAGKKKIYMRLVESRAIAGAAAIQFASHVEQRNSEKAIGGRSSFVCENAIEAGPRVPREPDWLRERHGIPRDRFVIGLAGRVHRRKGFEVIVPALARCALPVHLVSFGANEGDYQSRVEAIARKEGVLERLHFMGALHGEELQRAYASVDLLVMPSLGESFGNAALEALAQGTEVLVSDRVPVGYYIVEHGFGAVVAGLEPTQWAEAIDNRARGPRFSDPERISRRVRVDYDVRHKGEELLKRYKGLLAGPRDRR
jgi:glycosyltransferase involved in cell wall biosynthesis